MTSKRIITALLTTISGLSPISAITPNNLNCRIKSVTAYGVNGIFITGPNGHKFFLPNAGIKDNSRYSAGINKDALRYGLGTICRFSEYRYDMVYYPWDRGFGWIPDIFGSSGLPIRPVSGN